MHSANCAEDRCDRTGAVLGPVGIPVVVQRQVLRFTEQKTVEVPQLQCSDRVVDVPAAVHRQGLDVPVILQRQVHADSRRCLRFSSLHELGYDGSEGIFGAFCAIFRALTPGVSPRCQATSCAQLVAGLAQPSGLASCGQTHVR